VQEVYKSAAAVAFHSTYWQKFQTFFKRVERLTFTFISYIRQLFAKE